MNNSYIYNSLTQNGKIIITQDILFQFLSNIDNINVDNIPVHQDLKKYFPNEYREMAVSGGEDYELLIPGHESLIRYISDSTDIDLHIIGEIEIGSGDVNTVDSTGARISLNTGGWDHFTEN